MVSRKALGREGFRVISEVYERRFSEFSAFTDVLGDFAGFNVSFRWISGGTRGITMCLRNFRRGFRELHRHSDVLYQHFW